MGCGQTKVADSLAHKSEMSIKIKSADISEEFLGGKISTSFTSDRTSKTEITNFDDLNYLKQTQSARIESLTIFYSTLINGLEVSYYIEDNLKTLTHSKVSGKKLRIDFFLNEAIASINCTYSAKGIHSIRIETTEPRTLEAVGSTGKGSSCQQVTLQKERVIIGFKGSYGKNLKSLYCYLVSTDFQFEGQPLT